MGQIYAGILFIKNIYRSRLLIDRMDVLKGYESLANVHIKNIEDLNQKLKKMKSNHERLQVISDFDYTLSKYHDGNGERLISSWGIIENSSVFPRSFQEKCKALFDKYHPYEVDPNMTIEEKVPLIAEWYKKLIEVFTVYITDIQHMEESLRGVSQVQLRDGVSEFVSTLHESQVPLLVFSAGFGPLIKEVMLKRGLFHSEYTKIHSNFLEFDELSQKVIGIKEPVVHVFNKNGGSYLSSVPPKEAEEIYRRKNILLLGDSLGDLSMSDGIFKDSNESTILKIGFLNHDIESYMDRYMNEYDVVVVDDQTMNFPLHILNLIQKN